MAEQDTGLLAVLLIRIGGLRDGDVVKGVAILRPAEETFAKSQLGA